MIRFSFVLPSFLQRLLPQWLRSDLEQRSTFNGKASRSFLHGVVTIQAEQQGETIYDAARRVAREQFGCD